MIRNTTVSRHHGLRFIHVRSAEQHVCSLTNHCILYSSVPVGVRIFSGYLRVFGWLERRRFRWLQVCTHPAVRGWCLCDWFGLIWCWRRLDVDDWRNTNISAHIGISSLAAVCSRAVGKAASPFSITKPLHILLICAIKRIYFTCTMRCLVGLNEEGFGNYKYVRSIPPRQHAGLLPLRLMSDLMLEWVGGWLLAKTRCQQSH